MSRKKILVVFPGPLFPLTMGSQMRTKRLVERLTRVHTVDLLTFERSPISVDDIRAYSALSAKHIPVAAARNLWNRVAREIYRCAVTTVNGYPRHYLNATRGAYVRKVLDVARTGSYDILHFAYYFSCRCLDWMVSRPKVAIDTCNIMFKKAGLELNTLPASRPARWWRSRQVRVEQRLEEHYLGLSRLLISITRSDRTYLERRYPEKAHLTVPSGIDLEAFCPVGVLKAPRPTVLYFGNLKSAQNLSALELLLNDAIPEMRRRIPDLELRVVGADWEGAERLCIGKPWVKVTGYAEDLPQVLGACHVMLLPMLCGTGFRTRVIEAMAAGVPVIGTHIALDSIEVSNGVDGFVDDCLGVLIERAVELLRDARKREAMSVAAREFVRRRYSLDCTYGELARYYAEWE